MGSIRVDLHFHPNIYGSSNVESICTAILEKCLQWNIKALVVSEHVYKDPTASFQALHMTRQKLIRSGNPELQGLRDLILFPGVEYMCMEGCEMVLFHDYVTTAGKTIIYNIKERDILFHKPYHYTVTDVIGLAHKYGFSIYAPHPELSLSVRGIEVMNLGAVQLLGKTRAGRAKIAQLVEHRRIGMSMYNAGWDILLKLGVKNAEIMKLVFTPQTLLDDAKPTFIGGGSDAHGPDGLGSGLTLTYRAKNITRREVYKAITRPRGKVAVFRAKKGVTGFMQTLHASLKSLKISNKEVILENEILEGLEELRDKALETYALAHEAYTEALTAGQQVVVFTDINGQTQNINIQEFYKYLMMIKELFRGQEMMKMLSGEQKQRVLAALRKRQQMRQGGAEPEEGQSQRNQ